MSCHSCGCDHPKGQHPIPRDFTGPMAEHLLKWGATRGYNRAQIRFACETTRDWADRHGKVMKCWPAAVRGYIREGWALRGFKGAPGSLPETGRKPQALLIVGSEEWRRAQEGR